ncbi:MAG: hypothetical protein KGR99_11110 [Betaproteobacteria bacterium]|nr:hypothetical protein [Betaproteobacteria bacterium]MBU6512842.1 hypothetical protein [Betaproteobacteria bacterium]MDE2152627.1 hypothetical protein [Betaproteobacteria bacterium]
MLALLAGAAALPGCARAAAGSPTPRTCIALGPPQRSTLPDLKDRDRQALDRGSADDIEFESDIRDLFTLDEQDRPRRSPTSALEDAKHTVRYLQGHRGFDLDSVWVVAGKLSHVGDHRQEFTRWLVVRDPLPGLEVMSRTTRDRVYALAARFHKLGWRRFIAADEPRLQGRSSVYFKLQEQPRSYALDPAWVPGPDLWRSLAGMLPRWHWTADGMHLEMTLTPLEILGQPRMVRPQEINDKSVYFVQVQISTAKQHFGIPPWPAAAAEQQLAALRERIARKDLEKRRSIESRLRKSGTSILDSYRDPPLPDLS